MKTAKTTTDSAFDAQGLHQLLEFDKLLHHVKQYCVSPLGCDRFDALEMMTDTDVIEQALCRVQELKDILEHDKPFPLKQIWDIGEALDSAAVKGTALREASLIHVYDNLSCARALQSYLIKRRDTAPALYESVALIQPLTFLEDEIRGKIDFDSVAVKDAASPALKQIRAQIAREERNIKKAVDAVFRHCSQKGYLQEPVISLSSGRLVLPMKIEHKNRINGVVHDVSASGATVFVEPVESFELNNKITALRQQEADEVDRILRQITALVREHAPAIRQHLTVLAEIDFIHAKARYAQESASNKPALNRDNILEIVQGCHPLLLLHKGATADVVPLNLRLTADIHTLVITGPNAGGKSVALKTVGLLCMMVQHGFLIPAHSDSNIPVFDTFFADIGDFQSIENDLSTFSSHIQRTKSILAHASCHSLVLIDEIGTGTDPEEGAALAIAILEELTRRQCLTLVTTHLGTLKLFAFETDGIENGSMEFDLDTLQPLYKFRLGLPGSSYALEISRRLGVPDAILDRSKQLVGADKTKLENLILEMEARLQSAEKTAQQLSLEKNRLEGLSNLYKQRYEAIKSTEKQLKEAALRESEEIIRASNALIEKAVREIKEQQASTKAIKQAKQRIAEQKAGIEKQRRKLTAAHESPQMLNTGTETLAAGTHVLWEKQNSEGHIVSLSENGQKALLQAGQVKFWVPTRELRPIKETKTRPTKAARAIKLNADTAKDVLPVIDVRGERLEDALSKVGKFLDDAVLAGWHEVRIIHGKGTGVLRKGIAEYLETSQLVKGQKAGAWNEGDVGVTVVDLN